MKQHLNLALAFQENEANRSVDIGAVLSSDEISRFRRNETSRQVKKRRQCLFRNDDSVAGIVGSDHPKMPAGHIDTSTLSAFNSLVGRLALGDIREGTSDTFVSNNAGGNLVVFGGPVSTLHSRFLFGDGGKSPMLSIYLPVNFYYDESNLTSENTGNRPWGLIVDGNKLSTRNDYLTITSIPLGRPSEDRTRILFVAGLYGAGTRAFDLLLQNKNKLTDIEKRSRHFQGWQSYTIVNAKDYETPIELEDTHIFEIEYDFEKSLVPIREKIFLDSHDLDCLRNIPLFQRLLGKSNIRDNINAVLDARTASRARFDLGHHDDSPDVGGHVGRTRGSVANVSSADESANMDDPILHTRRLLRERRTLLIPKDKDEDISRGRPRKESEPSSSLRRLALKLTDYDFARIEKLRSLSEASTITDVIRDALRVYERVVDSVTKLSR